MLFWNERQYIFSTIGNRLTIRRASREPGYARTTDQRCWQGVRRSPPPTDRRQLGDAASVLQEKVGTVIATGNARRTRYALWRPLRGDLTELPVYEIDTKGRAELVTYLTMVHPQGVCMRAFREPSGRCLTSRAMAGGMGWRTPCSTCARRDTWGQLVRAEHRHFGVSANRQQRHAHRQSQLSATGNIGPASQLRHAADALLAAARRRGADAKLRRRYRIRRCASPGWGRARWRQDARSTVQVAMDYPGNRANGQIQPDSLSPIRSSAARLPQ